MVLNHLDIFCLNHLTIVPITNHIFNKTNYLVDIINLFYYVNLLFNLDIFGPFKPLIKNLIKICLQNEITICKVKMLEGFAIVFISILNHFGELFFYCFLFYV
jgi:hypothetical protein